MLQSFPSVTSLIIHVWINLTYEFCCEGVYELIVEVRLQYKGSIRYSVDTRQTDLNLIVQSKQA